MLSRIHGPSARLMTLLLAGSLALGACSDSGGNPEAAPSDTTSGSGSSSAAESPYLPVPDDVELTAQGSALSFGDSATVAYEPRQDTVGALDVTVTRVDKASFKLFVGWKINDEIRSTTPYFVHVTIENVGETDLGGRPVPLYAVDGDNKLIEASTFASTFEPCPSKPLPEKFATGDSTKACLVYLAPDKGEVTGVSFRPTEEFNPIVWTGEITQPKGSKKKKDKKN